jgi:enoyl-CoA hydratase/carnithine racemase
MSQIVSISYEAAHVAHVQLNRPEKKNALSLEMFEALPNAAAGISEDRETRVVVISGRGGDFCAGLDLAMFQYFAPRIAEIRETLTNPPAGECANFFQKPVTCWQDLPQPVVAAIDGVCFGGGMQLALAADFRIASPEARFSIMETRWGLIPDMGISRSLPKLMRADQAKELIMTARVIDAKEALSLGLITRIADDPVRSALDLASSLATRSPDAIQASKKLVDNGWSGSAVETLALEARLQAQIIGGPNQVEAVLAGMQKRDPDFA